MTATGSTSRVLAAAALGGQRIKWLNAAVPSFARGRLHRLVRAASERSAATDALDDWSSPLLGNGVAGPAQAVTGALERWPESARASAAECPSDAARCLLATSDLDVGGMDEMVAFLARRLRSHGYQTAVLHTCKAPTEEGSKGRLASLLSEAGIEVVKGSERAGRRWIREWQPDVISAHGASRWVLDEARSLSIPYVDVLHGMHSLFSLDRAAEEERSRSVAAIVAVSELVRRQYLERMPMFPADRIITIPNGVDDERRAPVERQAARAVLGLREEFLFVSLARHCLQKNTFALVSAFEEVVANHPDAHLLIAGRPEDPLYCRQARRLRDRLSCRDRIHLRDHASDPSLVLSAADGFVLNSFFEGWALASMEALHAGVPVIVSDVGGAREQIGGDGSCGYLVRNPLGDPLAVNWKSIRSVCFEPQVNRRELVAAMNALVRDRVRWATQREELAAASAHRFHPERCVRDHATLLQSVAGGRSRSRDHEALLRRVGSQ